MTNRTWPDASEKDVLRGLRISLRQYVHYGQNVLNSDKYRESLVSWLREALAVMEPKMTAGEYLSQCDDWTDEELEQG
ncbi:hypothetical protein [Mycolicibacterium septicum]|uniref:hypothetical protein n=1 Tax=Mycolicibacterium septicum TaxID=98668 RepID=UPI001AF2EA77|nr:hypothetical protein [Mycolicibacterium septicum]QRY51712.1 hypothetical protein JVX95_30775 [Mycolicibacterium septicum]